MVKALIMMSPADSDRSMSPSSPYLEINQTSEAKQPSSSGWICDGIQVAINIRKMTPMQIVTSYFPLAWNRTPLNDRMAHSSPNTSWMYGTMKSADCVSLRLDKDDIQTYLATETATPIHSRSHCAKTLVRYLARPQMSGLG